LPDALGCLAPSQPPHHGENILHPCPQLLVFQTIYAGYQLEGSKATTSLFLSQNSHHRIAEFM
jgi:hypothetical protein